MDTKSLDKQDKAHLQIYQNFMFAAKISIIAIIATGDYGGNADLVLNMPYRH